MPPACSPYPNESDNSYPQQAMFAAEHSSNALMRTHDFAYTNLPHVRPQDCILCIFYPSRRQTERQPASSVCHDLLSMYT
ncbi:hypothetical protein M405DRAFT_823023 [Rhizopogon salebrosus TDB-379]|nr:hypothetical protein M405DRAFT_823023 [Rhizopogon salebrosus TDB-379]